MNVVEKTTGRFRLTGCRYEPSVTDPAMEVVETDREPDKDRERWDFAVGAIREATTKELASAAAESKSAEALREIDGAKALRALVIWLAPKVGKTPAQARDEIVAIYKTL